MTDHAWVASFKGIEAAEPKFIDLALSNAFVVSDALAQALKAAKVDASSSFTRCKVI